MGTPFFILILIIQFCNNLVYFLDNLFNCFNSYEFIFFREFKRWTVKADDGCSAFHGDGHFREGAGASAQCNFALMMFLASYIPV